MTSRVVRRRPLVASGVCGSERGQSLVETVLVVPFLVFIVLGAVQLMLIAHARVMTEYAAYCATRAGIVHNGDWEVMRNAAMIAAMPLYQRTDDLEHFAKAWAKVKTISEASEAIDEGIGSLEKLVGKLFGIDISGIAPNLSLIDLRVDRPRSDDFDDFLSHAEGQKALSREHHAASELVYPQGEIDFDDLEFLAGNPEAGRLAVEVRVLYPLRIPLLGKIIFEMWLAQTLLNAERIEATYQEWMRLEAHIGSGEDKRALSSALTGSDGSVSGLLALKQWAREVPMLREIGKRYGLYLVPMRAAYAMQLQSNMFRDNAREPAWFGLGGDADSGSGSGSGGGGGGGGGVPDDGAYP